jgi:hypothetical protein
MNIDLFLNPANNSEPDFIYGASLSTDENGKVDQPQLDPVFDKIDWNKLPQPGPTDDWGSPQFIIGFEGEQLTALIETYQNAQTNIVAKKDITVGEAIIFIIKLAEHYTIIDINNSTAIFRDDLCLFHIKDIAEYAPNYITWAIEKAHYNKDGFLWKQYDKYDFLWQMSRIRNPVVLNRLLENQSVIDIIGKETVVEYRRRLPGLDPVKYRNLQMRASVLKEIGAVKDAELEEYLDGILPNQVIAEILSGYIPAFGLYNVIEAIKTAPKNIYSGKNF